MVCGSSVFQLHHIRYSRLGREHLKDLLPFCAGCHHKLHNGHKSLGVALTEFRMVLTLVFRLSTRQIMDRLEGYSKL